MYRCDRCGEVWKASLAEENDLLCTRRCGGRLNPVDDGTGTARVGGFVPPEISRLPAPIAVPLLQFHAETHRVMRLHRSCDAVEILTRFLTTIALAEVRRRGGAGPLPEALANTLRQQIERPSFGQWCGILRSLLDELAPAEMVVPELIPFVAGELLPMMPGGSARPEECLLGLRNLLAHGGALGPRAANEYLDVWEPRVRGLLGHLGFLSDVEIGRVGGDALRVPGSDDPRPLAGDLVDELRAVDGHLVALRRGKWLDLWPLCDFRRATMASVSGRRESEGEGPLVYYRSERDRLLYAALGLDPPVGERRDLVAAFRELFTLDAARESDPATQADFEAELLGDSAALVGRQDEVSTLKAAVKATQAGVLWVFGPGGVGKSFLMARLAADLGNDPRRVCRVAWRFKASDQARCNRIAFLRHAVARLVDWLGVAQSVADTPEELRQQLGGLLDRVGRQEALDPRSRPPRVVFVLDGLDEIARADPALCDVPFELSRPNVVWVCAGRPEGRAHQAFAIGRCVHVFEGGLPGMSPDDIRAMLLESIGELKYDFLRRDEDPGAGAGSRNPEIEAIVARAQGLPLFVRLVIEDLRAGTFAVDQLESRLPPCLEAYYDDMLRRMSIGDLHALLTPLVVAVAWGRAPLEADLLGLLMERRKVLTGDAAGRILLDRGLEAAHAMLRPASVGSSDRFGFEPYHPTFREHVQASVDLQQQAILTRQEFCELAASWADLPPGHFARDYLARHGFGHCADGARPGLAGSLAVAIARSWDWSHIAAFVESVVGARGTPAAPVEAEITKQLDSCGEPGAHLMRLLLGVSRMPTSVAWVSGRTASLGDPLARLYWVVEVVANAIRFTGVLSAVELLDVGPLNEQLTTTLESLRIPSLGSWANCLRAYGSIMRGLGSDAAFRPLVDAVVEPSGRPKKALAALVETVIRQRNVLAHGSTLDRRGADETLRKLLVTAADFVTRLSVLQDGELLVVRELRAGAPAQCRRLVGGRPDPANLVDVALPAEVAVGELLFRWPGRTPLSLRPFLLFDPSPGAAVPLLQHDRVSNQGQTWSFSRLEDMSRRSYHLVHAEKASSFRDLCARAREDGSFFGAPADDRGGPLPAPPLLTTGSPEDRTHLRPDLPILPALVAAVQAKREADPSGAASLSLVRDLIGGFVGYVWATALGLYTAGFGRSREADVEVTESLGGFLSWGARLTMARRVLELVRQAPEHPAWLDNPAAMRTLECCGLWLRWQDQVSRPDPLAGIGLTPESRRRLAALPDELASLASSDPLFALPRFEARADEEGLLQLVQTWPGGLVTRMAPWLWLGPGGSDAAGRCFLLSRVRGGWSPHVLLIDAVDGTELRSEEAWSLFRDAFPATGP